MKSDSATHLKDTLLTALTPILWGTTYIVTTELLPADRPLMASVIRVLPAGILLTLISRQLPNTTHGQHILLKMVVLSCLNIALFQALLFTAAYRLPGGVAAVIGSVQPLMIMALLAIMDNKKPNKFALLATVSSIVGMAMLLLQGKQGLIWDKFGVTAAFLGAISMATGIYLTKRWKSNLQGVNNLTFTGWQLLFGGVILLPFAMIFESLPTQLTPLNVIGYGYLAIFGSLIAYILWFRGIEKINPVSVSMLGALSPITATIIGWAYLGQSLSMVQMTGFVVVMMSVMVVQIQSR